MIRATSVLPAGKWDRAKEADRIELPHDGRHRRRVAMRGAGDTVFLLDLSDATLLRDGDGLELEDGRVVRVVAAAEPIVEITGEPHLLARLAWHLGNRHVPAQILPDRIRIGRDHVLEEMVTKLGGRVARIEAPFDPEAGAYAHEEHGRQAHHHDHDHGHDHQHGHRHGR
ncbi:MAG TPA: urease accessory protein UreE [Xanthobacteraceae bacterium]|jgi:urease accessory protein|nr:urease accessory protein UreE [Xanthobacteraceae bacterium]